MVMQAFNDERCIVTLLCWHGRWSQFNFLSIHFTSCDESNALCSTFKKQIPICVVVIVSIGDIFKLNALMTRHEKEIVEWTRLFICLSRSCVYVFDTVLHCEHAAVLSLVKTIKNQITAPLLRSTVLSKAWALSTWMWISIAYRLCLLLTSQRATSFFQQRRIITKEASAILEGGIVWTLL